MSNSDFDILLADAKTRFDEAKADLEALERVRRMRHKAQPGQNGQAEPTQEKPDDEAIPSAGRGELKLAIKKFITAAHGTFTMLDIFKAIDDAGQIVAKKQSIKAALGALEKKGEIETITRGTGRKPSIYRRKR